MGQIAALQASGGPDFEVIFVDGGSTDGTPAEIRAAGRNSGALVAVLESDGGRGGYGADIKRGLSHARGMMLAWTHADLQCDISDVLRAREAYRMAGGGQILVKGARTGRPMFDRLFTRGMQAANYVLSGNATGDINGQPKLFPRDFFERFLRERAPDDFALDLFALNAAASGDYRIIDIPVKMRERLHGEAKGGGSSLSTKIRLARRTAAYMWSSRGRS